MRSKIFGLHHIGIHVSDLEAGRRFYETVFGFEVIGVDRWDEGNADINAYVGLDESSADSYMLRGANIYIEIWAYRSPTPIAAPRPTLASDLGYTHICFQVEDFDEALDAFLTAGGTLIKPLTSARPGGARMHYCRDPFGNIVEILQVHRRATGRLGHLPAISSEGTYADATDQYYLLENGAYVGMRYKAELEHQLTVHPGADAPDP